MKATYDKSKIMRNAWYLKRVEPAQAFSACLKKAWRNEKLANIHAHLEGRNLAAENAKRAAAWTPVAVPADYYGERGRYYGD